MLERVLKLHNEVLDLIYIGVLSVFQNQSQSKKSVYQYMGHGYILFFFLFQ